MPIYSYACRDCDHRFDIQQAFSDDALTRCPECGGALRKVFSAVGVVFKGSGFYRTDNRKGTSSAADAPTTPVEPGKQAKPGKPGKPVKDAPASSTGSGEAAKSA